MRRSSLYAAVFAVSLWGCGVDSVAALEELDDEVELDFAELDASVLLPFVNAGTTTVELLTLEAGVEARAAKNVVARRDGADGRFGTPDDAPFTSIADLDAVPYVGPAALARLDAFAIGRQAAGTTTVDGVAFTADEAQAALAAVNGASLTDVGLSATATKNLLAARPFTTLEQVGAVAYVGPSAMTTLRTWARAHPAQPAPMPAACQATGGTFDGVAFTAEEDCHALDFLAKARLSEMGALNTTARGIAYQSVNGTDTSGFRKHGWTSVKAFSERSSIGQTAMAALKAAAASWTQRGLGYDTVADVWANRRAMADAPVGFEKLYVSKAAPDLSWGGYHMQCVELRDAPGASNYLVGCYPAFFCLNSGDCWKDFPVGSWVSARGSLRTTSLVPGGYAAFLTGSPREANAAIR